MLHLSEHMPNPLMDRFFDIHIISAGLFLMTDSFSSHIVCWKRNVTVVYGMKKSTTCRSRLGVAIPIIIFYSAEANDSRVS